MADTQTRANPGNDGDQQIGETGATLLNTPFCLTAAGCLQKALPHASRLLLTAPTYIFRTAASILGTVVHPWTLLSKVADTETPAYWEDDMIVSNIV